MNLKSYLYFLSFIFPLAIYIYKKKIIRGVSLHAISIAVSFFSLYFLKYIFTVPNNITLNLILLNIFLIGTYSFIIYDSVKIIKK